MSNEGRTHCTFCGKMLQDRRYRWCKECRQAARAGMRLRLRREQVRAEVRAEMEGAGSQCRMTNSYEVDADHAVFGT